MPDLGDRNSPCSAGLNVPFPSGFTFSFGGRSGLVDVDAGTLRIRSEGGRGDMGMFSRKHSSGTSSPSSSSHSFSSSFAVFLSLFACQLDRLAFNEVVERLYCCLGIFGLVLLFRLIVGREGELGLVNPLRDIITPLCVGINPKPSVAFLTCGRRDGYAGRFPTVNSLCIRLPCVTDIGIRFLADVRRSAAKVASYGLLVFLSSKLPISASGLESSSSPISSKFPTSERIVLSSDW